MDPKLLRSLTYSRGDISDRTIDTDFLALDCPLDQCSSKTPCAASIIQNPSTASLGRLDQLPTETLHTVFENLDLHTLTLLRSINKRMNSLVDSLLPYKELFTHAPNALRALLSTGAARYFSAKDAQRALRAETCFACGTRFGAYLYLLECRRCCWNCLISSKDLMPIAKEAAEQLYHVEEEKMASVPTVLHIPGSYGPKQRRRPNVRSIGQQRIELVANGAAKKAGGIQNGRSAERKVYKEALLATRIALRGPVEMDSMRDMDCMNYDPAGYKAGYGLEPQRFMVAVRFPALMGGGGEEVEWGVSCLGCLEGAEEGEEESAWNETFTWAGVGVHLGGCEKAEKEWVSDRVKELGKR